MNQLILAESDILTDPTIRFHLSRTHFEGLPAIASTLHAKDWDLATQHWVNQAVAKGQLLLLKTTTEELFDIPTACRHASLTVTEQYLLAYALRNKATIVASNNMWRKFKPMGLSLICHRYPVALILAIRFHQHHFGQAPHPFDQTVNQRYRRS